MRFRVFVLFLIAACVPALLLGETLYLTDGSTLKGKLVRYVNDTLYFETGFGATIAIPKDKIQRIVFSEGEPEVPAPGPAAAAFTYTAPGSLRVVFDKVEVSSRVSVDRGKDREAIERENWIEEALRIGNRKVYSHIDSTMDKVVRNGPETILKNDFTAVDFTVPMAPDFYHATLVIGNTFAKDYKDRFDPEPLDRRLLLENLRIEPGKTTIIRVGVKKKMWGLSKGPLYIVQ
ncbi:MAG: hypothetical protein P8181_11620 [bacterium]